MKKIHLVLSDDWELKGDGSGNVRTVQFETMKRIAGIYEKYDLRCSFNVEVMQQIKHLEFGEKFPLLRGIANEWEALVREVYSRGHDVQLHVHPQWHEAVYVNDGWHLSGSWSILDYPETVIKNMLFESKSYLEDILRKVDPEYRCVSFRSGAWCLAPSDYILKNLASLGIVFDMSLAEGIFYDFDQVKLDYRGLDEGFLPYYPNMSDARRKSDRKQPIVCVPTYSFNFTWPYCFIKSMVRRIAPDAYKENFMSPDEIPVEDSGYEEDYSRWESNDGVPDKTRSGGGILNKIKSRFSNVTIETEIRVADLSHLGYRDLVVMMKGIREKAKRSGWSEVPVILENHTKNVGYFKPIEKFCAYIASSKDIEVITASELSNNIEAGVYPI